MFARLRRGFARLPWFRFGMALVALSAVVDGLDALAAVDIGSLIPAHRDAAKVGAMIAVTKIVLRGVLVIATAFRSRDGPE